MNRRTSVRISVVTSLLIAALAGAGCSMVQSKKIDYKSAGKLPQDTLEVPPDLTQPQRDDRYAVPDVSPKGTATYSVYSAERTGANRATTAPEILPKSDKIRLERAGSQRWLVVPGTPDKLWPAVKDFWQETGFIVNIEQPEAGIMETDWAENRAKIPQDILRNTIGKVLDGIYSTPERDKFRTRLENGTEPGTTEIYISHRGMIEIYPTEARDTTIWQPRPADPELEAEMLSKLLVRLGVEDERAKTVVANEPRAERAKFDRAGNGNLMVQEGFDRAWRRVGLALDRVGFTVEDRDRSQGLYFVRYIDPQADNKTKKEEEGLLSKLKFWGSDKKDDKNAKAGAQYRIQVKGESAGETSSVKVLTADGAADGSDSAKKILALLYDQLK